MKNALYDATRPSITVKVFGFICGRENWCQFIFWKNGLCPEMQESGGLANLGNYPLCATYRFSEFRGKAAKPEK